jgi:uracil-DNA glycosylase family 4
MNLQGKVGGRTREHPPGAMPQPKKKRVVKLIQLEKLSKASESNENCLKCGLHESCRSPFIHPMVPDNWTGKFLLIGDSSHEFERTGNLYASLGGQQLKDALREAKVTRQDVAFMPVLRCKPVGPAKMHQLRACAPYVYRAVQLLKPKYVLGMGPNAAKSLANTGSPGVIPRLRGRLQACVYEAGTFQYYITASLPQLGTSPNEYARFKEDIARFDKPVLAYPKNAVPQAGLLGFDTEYTPDKVLCGALSDGRSAVTVAAQNLSRLSPLLAKSIIVGHNLPVDLDALLKAKVSGLNIAMEQWLRGRKQRDTLLMAKLADENRGVGGYTLESLLLADYNATDYKAPTEALGPDPMLWPDGLRNERCRLDAWATLKVFEATDPLCLGPQAITHAIAMTLHRMKYIGVYISMDGFQTMKREVYTEEAKTRASFRKLAAKKGMKDFNPTDANIRELVYNKLGLAVESRTKAGLASASVKVLKEYATEYPEIAALIAFSKADKLKTTYVDGLEKRFVRQKDGRFWLPVNINALAAKTGRRSSSGPNFQNLPVRVRQIIVPRFVGGSIASVDYSKLEPTIGGWITGEHKLTEYFTKYPNGYIKIGTDFFKKTVEKNTKEYTMVKSLILGILYNKQKWSLAEDIWGQGIKLDSDYERHVDKAGDILERFLSELFPGVKAYQKRQEEFVLEHGYVDNAVGQRRRLPLPPRPDQSDKIASRIWRRFKAHVINQSINFPIQSFASYVTGSALIDLEAAFLRQYNWSYYDYHQALMAKDWPKMPLIICEVHDELVQDIPKGMEKKTKAITQEIMCSVPTLRNLVPEFTTSLAVDINTGPTWGLKG